MRAVVVETLVFAALVGLVFAPLERLFPQHGRRRTARGADVAFATLGTLLTRGLLTLVVGGALTSLDRLAPDAPLVDVGDGSLASTVELGIALLVFETMGYVYHRLAHAVPWLYRVHEVHHASENLDWLASFRQHPIEIVLATLMQNAPLVLLGIPLGAHATVVLLLRLNTVFVHSDLRVPEGPWTSLLATPRFHHRHHQRTGAAVNFAALFPWLDRLFGTHDAATATEFGLERPMPSSFVGLMLHPLVGLSAPSATREADRSEARLEDQAIGAHVGVGHP